MSVAASSLSFIDGSILNVALPAIREGTGAGAAEVQWVVNGYTLPLAALILLGGGAAFIAHAGKAGARTLVNASPEPFSNVIVSTGEDVATGGLLALAIANPIAAAIIALGLMLLSIWLVIAARRALRRLIDRVNPRQPAA